MTATCVSDRRFRIELTKNYDSLTERAWGFFVCSGTKTGAPACEMGRPKLPVDEVRSVVVTAMVRPQERAKQLDTSQSVLVRRALLRFLNQQGPAATEEGT